METITLEATMQTAIQQMGNEAVHVCLVIAVLTAVLLTGAWMAAGFLRTAREL